MEIQELKDLLIAVVRDNKKHKNYDHTVKVAEKAYRYVTGEGLDDELQQFTPRESEVMFTQRKQFTKHVIPPTLKNIIDIQFKVPRSNSLTRVLEYEGDESNQKAADFEEIIGSFWGDKSFDDYLGQRFIELNNVDPNTFVIAEFKDFDYTIEHAQPYPFEAKSVMAVDYEYENNILQYLVVKQDERYTVYLKERAVILDIISDKQEISDVKSYLPKVDTWYNVAGYEYIRFNAYPDKIFRLFLPEPYDLDVVPAYRIGYKRDLVTDGETYVPPWWDTLPILEKTIKVNSELDITMCLHTFPQKIITGRKCSNPLCLDGYIYNEKTKCNDIACPKCKGAGMLPHTSAQDVVIIELPKSKEEQLSIDNLIRYVSPPIELIDFQNKYVEELTWKIKQVMFNSDIFTREEVAETATGKNIDMQNVYDTLWPLAVKYADAWEFFVGVIAALTDMDNDLVADFSFDKDFKMKTTTDLYNDLSQARNSGADSFAIADIQQDIARSIFANSPGDFQKYLVKQGFYPFSGKTTEEKIALKSSNNTTRFNKVLDDNYGVIFDEIELETPDFYELNKEKQWEILQAKVNELIAQIDAETPQTQTL